MWEIIWVNMKRELIITMDERGRVTIPKEIREKIKTKKLRLKIEGDKIILEPVNPDIEKYYGIFKNNVGNVDIDEVLEKSLTEVLKNDC
ncbi:AbrB/MazE/SpoVT family DNA-binding domain-containing protein [Acidianus brierleyi]|nr:AbrB/MazE/SpoVT family DNA-binding domain-containing protein [Acidianus brierleyi]